MKKIYLTMLLVFTATLFAQAQYFQHVYGYKAGDYGTKVQTGMVTSATGPGHVVAGLNIVTTTYPGDFGIHVLRTDVDGRLPSPNEFNNTYLIQDGAGNQLRVMATAAVELSDGSGYGVIGSYCDQTSFPSINMQGIAYLRLNLQGKVVAAQGYYLSGNRGIVPYVNGLRESTSTPGELFATGSNGDQMWAMKVDQNGTLLWGQQYSVGATPQDIIESPYAPTVIIVGGYSSSGFWMEVDPNTGTCTRFDVINSWPVVNNRYLMSIDVAADPSSPGFILAGEADGKAWVTKTQPFGSMMWSGYYQSSARPYASGWYMRGYDAVGRPKQDAQNPPYEYFVTGPIWSTSSNGDAFVFKLDDWGNPMNPNALFSYNTGMEETGVMVDVNTSGTADGVSMYAVNEYTPSSEREIYIVKAYFNGVSGCNESFEDLQRDVAEFYASSTLTVSSSPFSTTPVALLRVTPQVETELCYNATIPGGSNARTAPSAPEGVKQVMVSPNPMAAGTNTAIVQVESQAAEQVDVTIYDMLGKQYYAGRFTVAAGSNALPLDVSNANMAAGMYTVKVSGLTANHTILLMVK